MKLFESFLFFAISTGNPVEGDNENLIPLLQLQVNSFFTFVFNLGLAKNTINNNL